MKNYLSFLFFLGLFCWNSAALRAQISEGFETSSCGNTTNAFFAGCFPGWISTSGTADIQSNQSGISPTEGSRYVKMYARDIGFCSGSSTADRRSEGILLNFNFQAGVTYDIEYDMRWAESEFCFQVRSQWILTNGRSNQTGGIGGCSNQPGEITPTINSGDLVVRTHNINGNTNWATFTVSLTPNSNYSLLWLLHELLLSSSCGISATAEAFVYLDNFQLNTCDPSGAGYTTLFSLAPGSNFGGSVFVNCSANANPGPINHWWDVFYAPNGSTSGNTQVPGNPTIVFQPTAFFNQNMVVNEWYYIKHGIWSDCINWRESRKRFRVQIRQGPGSPQPSYELQVEDLPFEMDAAYTETMTQWARSGDLERLQSDASPRATPEPAEWGLTASDRLENFPNPSRDHTTIRVELAQAGPVQITVRDRSGRIVQVVEQGTELLAGRHEYALSVTGLAAGAYYATLQTERGTTTVKMIVLP